MATTKTPKKATIVEKAVARVRKPSTKQKAIAAKKEKNKAAWVQPKPEELSRPVDRTHVAKWHFTDEERAEIIPLVLQKLEEGKSLWSAVREVPNSPSAVMFQKWMRKDDALTSAYAQSRFRGYMMLAEDLLEISDNPHEGITEVVSHTVEGTEVKITRADMIEHRKLQVATRKWLLAKQVPKIFGDRAADAAKGDQQALADVLKDIASKLPV